MNSKEISNASILHISSKQDFPNDIITVIVIDELISDIRATSYMYSDRNCNIGRDEK